MARHDIDPVLQHLVRAINESDKVAVPVTVSIHGTQLTGALIAQQRYFAEVVQRNPLMSALEPSSGLLGKEYAKDTESESDYHLHMLAPRTPGGGETDEALWRISLDAIDGWVLRRRPGTDTDTDAEGDKGPFARLLKTP